MPTRLSLTSVSCAILLAVAIPSPRASAQGIFMTPIPGAPFSGVVNIERTIVHKDGSPSRSSSRLGRLPAIHGAAFTTS
jgi:hypothetical protein